jgi:hypothetical protein
MSMIQVKPSRHLHEANNPTKKLKAAQQYESKREDRIEILYRYCSTTLSALCAYEALTAGDAFEMLTLRGCIY